VFIDASFIRWLRGSFIPKRRIKRRITARLAFLANSPKITIRDSSSIAGILWSRHSFIPASNCPLFARNFFLLSSRLISTGEDLLHYILPSNRIFIDDLRQLLVFRYSFLSFPLTPLSSFLPCDFYYQFVFRFSPVMSIACFCFILISSRLAIFKSRLQIMPKSAWWWS